MAEAELNTCQKINSLTDVLDCLAACDLIDSNNDENDKVDTLINELLERITQYVREHHHIEYSLIHRYVFFDGRTPDVYDAIINVCDRLIYVANEIEKDSSAANIESITNTCLFVEKIKDHLQLETLRQNSYKGLLLISEQLNNSVSKTKFVVDEKLIEIGQLSQKIEQSEKSTVNMTVTVLGIFSAAILGISTGIQVLSGFFSASNDLSPYRLFALCAMSGIVVYNTLFLLLYAIAKITDNGIATGYAPNSKYFMKRTLNPTTWIQIAGVSYGEEIPQEKFAEYVLREPTLIKRFYCRYPYVFWPNVIFLGLLVAISCLWVAKYNFGWDWLPPR